MLYKAKNRMLKVGFFLPAALVAQLTSLVPGLAVAATAAPVKPGWPVLSSRPGWFVELACRRIYINIWCKMLKARNH